MHYHGVNLTVILKNGCVLDGYFGFDNEMSAKLSNQPDLFKNINTIEDFSSYFYDAFITETFDDDEEFDFKELMEDLGDIDYYNDFIHKLKKYKPKDISVVIILSDVESYGYRDYTWEKYNIDSYHVTRGQIRANWDYENNKYTPDLNEYIRNTIIQPGDISDVKPKKSKAAPKRTPAKAALTFEEFGTDYEYDIREEDMTWLGTTYPRGIIIWAYKGIQKILEIPAAVEDYPVVHIGSLGENDSVEEVIFDRDKITFSDDAFIDCDKLGTYDENGNKVMFDVLLKYKNIQKKMTLPGIAKKIGHELFKDNSIVEEVIISEGTEEICNCAFENCVSLRRVQFPRSLKRIGASAFSRCSLLTEVVFPPELEEIISKAYKNNMTWCETYMAETDGYCPHYIFSLPSPLFVKGNVLVKYIPQYGVKELVIPDSISEIGEAAFSNTELERIVLPNTIKTTGKNAFRETALKEIIIPNSVKKIGFSAFEGCLKLKRISFPSTVVKLEKNTFKGCAELETAILPGIRKIGDRAFMSCKVLENVSLQTA
jgi:hypothetical protein